MKGKERRFEENVHYTPSSLRSATLCCRNAVDYSMGSDAAFIGVMVGTWSGPRALCFMDGNQAQHPAGDRQGTLLMRPRCLAVLGISVLFDPTPPWQARLFACVTLCTFCLLP